jgi:serine/threonine-protein kinase
MITSEHYQAAKELFHQLKELPVDARAEYLAVNCSDSELRQMVERLVAADQTADQFIETPAVAFASDLFTEDWKDRRIGNYRIEDELGRGGMGIVFLASRADDEFQQKVALKIVQGAMNIREIRERFRRERQILAELDHPNIGRLLDGGTTSDGLPFFVMEFVEGKPITDFATERQLDLNERLHIFREVCSAVEYAHRHLVIHRDIKPSNILVTAERVPKLLDFGIAKLITPDDSEMQTQTGLAAMTPDYASPEQLSGRKITTATDIYSLGKVLTELVCGEQVKGDLQAVLQTALREEPDLRYKTVEQFSDDIERYRNDLPVSARPDSFSYRASKFVRRNRFSVAAAAIASVLLLVGIVSIIYQARVAADERDKARTEARKSERLNLFMQKVFGSADPRQQGRDVKVADTLDDAVVRAETELADQPEILADVRRTIGNSYRGLGLYDKAEKQIRAALDVHEKLLGEGHLETARSLRDLGILLRFKGEYAEAAEVFDRSLTIMRANRPDSDEDMVETLFEYGNDLLQKGETEASIPILQESYDLSMKVYGEKHFFTAIAINVLGLAYEYKGELETAGSLFQQAADICRSLPDKDRSECSINLMNLATNLTTRRRFEEAEAVFSESLAQTSARYGENHPSTAAVLTHFGRMLMLKGDLDRSETTLRKALGIQRQTLKPDHAEIPQTTSLLGLVLTKQGRAAEGEPFIREAIEVRKRILPPDHWLIANLESQLGECLTKQKRFDEAEVLLIKGREALVAKLGESHPRTLEATERLADFYRVSKRHPR